MKKVCISLAGLVLVGGFVCAVAGAEDAKPAAAPAAVAAPAAPAAPAGPKYGGKVGDVAKPTKLKDFDGKEVDTGELTKEGKVMLVLVNAACNVCNREMMDLKEHKDKFTAKAKIVIVAVDMNPEAAKPRYADYTSSFTFLQDATFAMGDVLDMNSTPATVILDKGGKILFKKSGYKDGGLKEVLGALQ